MNNYKVSLKGSTNYNIKLINQRKYKVPAVSGGVQVPAKFEDLGNFDYSDKNDQYIIMYDAVTQKYKLVNPDKVLSAATDDPISPGLPSNFKDQLDIDLDDKIDLDAGGF